MTLSVLVVPGVKGFKLVDSEAGEILWQLDHDRHTRISDLELVWDEQRQRYTAAGAVQVGAGDLETGIYGSLRTYLATTGRPVTYFRYDWRLPSLANCRLLAAQLAQHPPASVVLVAHSLGSLLTCAMLADEDCDTSPLAGIVFVSPPFAGAPAVLDAMINGDEDVPPDHRPEYRRISLSFPTLFELLPVYDQALFCGDKAFSLQRDLNRRLPGTVSDIVRRNFQYLLRFREVVSLDNRRLRERLQALRPRSLVVTSSGVATPIQIHLQYDGEGTGEPCFPLRTEAGGQQALRYTHAGDGRVPLRSASELLELFPSVIIGSREHPVNHSDIMRDERFLSTIRDFIEGLPAPASEAPWWGEQAKDVIHFPPGTFQPDSEELSSS